MQSALRSAPLLFSALALTLVLTGCPKRPATSDIAAPAPIVSPPAPAAPSAPAPAAPSAPAPAVPSSPSRPVVATPRPSEFVSTANLKDIHFDFDKYAIRPQDARILDANAAWLKAHGKDLVLIEGREAYRKDQDRDLEQLLKEPEKEF